MELSGIRTGDTLPERTFAPDEVQLFLYNAAIWNPHRIHYDLPYTTGEEGHPAIVIDGPLQGDFLTQLVLEWLGDLGTLTAFTYRNLRASYVGDSLTATGRVTDIDTATGEVALELALLNGEGEVVTPGSARVSVKASLP